MMRVGGKKDKPNLWLKCRQDGAAFWFIRDGDKDIPTVYRREQTAEAQGALADYLASCGRKPIKQWGGTSVIQNRVYEARRRAEKLGIPCDITEDFLRDLLRRQGEVCALTGIAFRNPEGGRNNPYVMSLDRIDSKGGYTQCNVRLVIFAMNAALGPWGEIVFRKVAKAYLAKTTSQTIPNKTAVNRT